MRYGADQRILSHVAPLSHARILSASFLEDTKETTADGGMGTPVWSTTQARGCSLVCYPSPFSQRLLRSVSNMTRLRSRPLDDTGFIPIAPLGFLAVARVSLFCYRWFRGSSLPPIFRLRSLVFPFVSREKVYT